MMVMHFSIINRNPLPQGLTIRYFENVYLGMEAQTVDKSRFLEFIFVVV